MITCMKRSIAKLIRPRLGKAVTGISVFLLALPACAQQFVPQLLPQPMKIEMKKGEYLRLRHPLDSTLTKDVRSSLDPSLPQEGYVIDVTAGGISVRSHDDSGLRHARTTLCQLAAGGRLPLCHIEDAPRYAWRGCMIDVSRHFFPVSFLKKQVDILSRYKINILQLHLTDAGGWRIQIRRYPELTRKAAWRTESDWGRWWDSGKDRQYMSEGAPGAYGGYYTQAELRELVAYAAGKGITVVPEIEMPGHSNEVTAACPGLKCEGNQGAQGDVCPSNEETYRFYCDVLREVMDIFPSHYIHIGGDEAGKEAWRKCPRCIHLAEQLRLASTDDLQGFLIQRMAAFLKLFGREAIGWDEVLTDKLVRSEPSLGTNMNVMVWRDGKAAREAMLRGHNVILTPGEYYLDRYQDDPRFVPKAFGGYLSLEGLWKYAPGKLALPDSLQSGQTGHILGVQGNLWTEQITTPDYAEYMLYPRELAIAERGWSGDRLTYPQLKASILAQAGWMKANHVNAFDLKSARGDRKETLGPVTHLARQARVTYNSRYADKYAASGDGSLVDGILGGWSNNDGRWQGFMQRGDRKKQPLDIVVDLGKVTPLHSITMEMMQFDSPWIFFPNTFRISLSDDGAVWREVYRKEQPREHLEKVSVRPWQWKGKDRGRYIHIEAGCDNPGEWIFTDEIIVK